MRSISTVSAIALALAFAPISFAQEAETDQGEAAVEAIEDVAEAPEEAVADVAETVEAPEAVSDVEEVAAVAPAALEDAGEDLVETVEAAEPMEAEIAVAEEVAPEAAELVATESAETKVAIAESVEAAPAEEAAVEIAEVETPVADVEAVDVLLMPANAEIMFITTGGSELRADWSEAAQTNLTTHLETYVADQGLTMVSFDEDAEKSEDLEQLLLLAEVVRNSAALNMPHKPKTTGNSLLSGNNRADLTLGDNVSLLKEAYGAEQVVFVDHYSQIESSGMFMAQVLIGAATGYVPVSQNFRGTVATVIDLDTGQITSRNFATMGDSRDVGESKGIVDRVMKKIELQ